MRADAAQVCSDVGFEPVDGPFECSAATDARQIVSCISKCCSNISNECAANSMAYVRS